MPISTRTYFLVGFGFALVAFLLSMVLGEDIAQWAVEQKAEVSQTSSFMASVAFEPIRFIFSPDTRPFGAIVLGFFWPFSFFLPLLVIIALIIGPASDTVSDVKEQTHFFYTMYF